MPTIVKGLKVDIEHERTAKTRKLLLLADLLDKTTGPDRTYTDEEVKRFEQVGRQLVVMKWSVEQVVSMLIGKSTLVLFGALADAGLIEDVGD